MGALHGVNGGIVVASKIWADIRKAAKSEVNNPWADLAPFEDEAPTDVPTPIVYTPIKADNEVPIGSVVFDLETGSVDDMWTSGPEFIRLSGHSIDNNDCYNSSSVFKLM